mgnify:CR=1 FL=1
MKTNKYTVIGNPINHSLSPKLQNYWLKENNINATYDKIKLEENEIRSFIQDIKKRNITGCNVTVPYKNTVIPFLDKLSSEADQTQSVNTIICDDGKLVGHNTDIAGFHRAIKDLNFDMKDKKVLILGAGGVVPSIIFALKRMDVSEITLSNRTRKKAEILNEQFHNLKIINWGEIINFDVIINATSLGLNNETMNLDFSTVGNNKLFYDVIYNPGETNFLKNGKRLGNQIENGKLMFIYQAFESFKLWHGIEPKVDEQVFKIIEND